MSTLVSTDAKSQRAYVPTTALAKSVNFDEEMMHVSLHWPELDEDLSVAGLMAGADFQGT
jgi:hypothetical protein